MTRRMAIYKYPLQVIEEQEIMVQPISKIIHVEFDFNNQLCVWAIVATEEKQKPATFRIFGTGHDFDEEIMHNLAHAGTVFQGRFVWHVFWKWS